jgi:HSP90 family molecular chaperone
LISNASDALEKLRQKTILRQEIADPFVKPEIQIFTDETNKTLTIQV